MTLRIHGNEDNLQLMLHTWLLQWLHPVIYKTGKNLPSMPESKYVLNENILQSSEF